MFYCKEIKNISDISRSGKGDPDIVGRNDGRERKGGGGG